jgi:site-specific recombinase XerD
MKTIVEELSGFEDYLKARELSPKVVSMYRNWTRKFLEAHPEAMDVCEEVLSNLIADYAVSIPINSMTSNIGVANRHYWAFRFGKPYFKRIRLRDFPRNEAIEVELRAYTEYLENTGHLAQSTICARIRVVKQFLYCAFDGKPFSRDLFGIDVVQRHLSKTMAFVKPSTRRTIVSDIRSYARFLTRCGVKAADSVIRLSLAVPSWQGASMPKGISEADYRRLTKSFDTTRARGSRGLAMVLCMGNLGLRSSDVARLTLDDFNWRNGTVTVHHSKSISDRRLPIDAETGDAIVAYLTDFRPKTEAREVFVHLDNLRRGEPLPSKRIVAEIGYAATMAGIRNWHGTHSLRHAVATNMLNNGVNIKVIADILGHVRVQTTTVYAKVDIENLRKVAALWPEGDHHERLI